MISMTNNVLGVKFRNMLLHNNTAGEFIFAVLMGEDPQSRICCFALDWGQGPAYDTSDGTILNMSLGFACDGKSAS